MSNDDERRLRLREASYLHSSSREALIEHVFVAEVLQEAWFAREQLVGVLGLTANGSRTIASTFRTYGSEGIPVNPSRI